MALMKFETNYSWIRFVTCLSLGVLVLYRGLSRMFKRVVSQVCFSFLSALNPTRMSVLVGCVFRAGPDNAYDGVCMFIVCCLLAQGAWFVDASLSQGGCHCFHTSSYHESTFFCCALRWSSTIKSHTPFQTCFQIRIIYTLGHIAYVCARYANRQTMCDLVKAISGPYKIS